MRFMRQEEALKAMDLFEGAQEHNRVSKRSLKNWVVTILTNAAHSFTLRFIQSRYLVEGILLWIL
jgi:hypothetical protein